MYTVFNFHRPLMSASSVIFLQELKPKTNETRMVNRKKVRIIFIGDVCAKIKMLP